LAHKADASVLAPMAIGLGVIVAGAFLVFALRHQLARLLRSGVTRLLSHWTRKAPECANDLERAIGELFHRRRRVASASALHVVCWFGGGGNIWVAYHLLGARIDLVDAMAIEGMLSTALGVGLLVPAALGVQEISYMALGAAFGVPPHLSLSLSLIRRARDLMIGVPALAVWELAEVRRLRRS